MRILKDVNQIYRVTEIVWHQGEADARFTLKETYKLLFGSLLETIAEADVDAPVFVSIASLCPENDASYPNRITDAQHELVDGKRVFLGVNTDVLITNSMRHDGCHFGKVGQLTAATELARIIARHKKSPSPQ